MSEENGNTVKYRVEQVENCCNDNKKELSKYIDEQKILFRETIQPFIDETKTRNSFIKNYKNDIKELNLMKDSIERIEKKLEKDEDFKKRVIILLSGAILSGIVIPIILRFV